MENSFVGLSGSIYVHPGHAVTMLSVQADVSDPSASDVNIHISGSLGTEYNFGAVIPIVAKLKFQYDEQVVISSSGTALNVIVINYIFRGDQSDYMTTSPSRVQRPKIGKWNV